MKRAELKDWLDGILSAWPDFVRLETEADVNKMVKEICKLYSKEKLARALLILKPLVKEPQQ